MDFSEISNNDTLLIKCKDAIEELLNDIEIRKKENKELQGKINDQEVEIQQKQQKLQDQQTNSDTLKEILEQQAQNYEQYEEQFEDLKNLYHQQLQQLDDLSNKNLQYEDEFGKRENIVGEWNQTMETVEKKIYELETQNNGKLKLRQELYVMQQQNENLNKLLVIKSSLIDQMNQKVDKETKDNEDKEIKYKTVCALQDELKRENSRLNEIIQRSTKKEEDHERILTIRTQQQQYLQIEKSLHEKYSKMIEGIKQQTSQSIDKLQANLEISKREIQNLLNEKEQLERDIDELREELEIKNQNANLEKEEQRRAKENENEQRRLQGIVADQNELILSYERVLDNNRNETTYKLEEIMAENKQQKQEIKELGAINKKLNERLIDCQTEIQNLNLEIREIFSIEEKKQAHIFSKLNELEQSNSQKENIILDYQSEINFLKVQSQQLAEELNFFRDIHQNYNKEQSDQKDKLRKLAEKNEILNNKNSEIGYSVRKTLDEYSEKVKTERKKRIEAENLSLELEETLRVLEAKYKRVISLLQEEVDVKDKALKKLKQQLNNNQPLQFKNTNIQKSIEEVESTTNTKSNDILFTKDEKILAKLKDQMYKNKEIEEYLNKYDFDSSVCKENKNKKIENQKTEFIDKFRTVINRLENKLLQINQDDLKYPSSFLENKLYSEDQDFISVKKFN